MKSRVQRVTCRLGVGTLILAGGLMACSGRDADSSAVPLAEAEITIERGVTTTVRSVRVAYEGESGRIKDIAFAVNGDAAGRMEAHYSADRLTGVDVIDGDGDRGNIAFTYQGGVVHAMQFTAPSVYTITQEYEYDERRSGVPREMTTRMAPASGTAQTSYRRFEHDAKLRLERITDIVGQTTSTVELRFDDTDRVERATTYAGNSVVETFDYKYDAAGRIETVTSGANDRWDVRYSDGGNISEIRQISPRTGETTTIRYRYRSGALIGLRFTPDLPQASLFDLRGESLQTVNFLAFTPATLSAAVPSIPGGGGGGGGELTCAGYTAETTCDICEFTYCCPQLERCIDSDECWWFYDCAAQCSDAECYGWCGTQYPTGRAQYEAYSYCARDYCSAQCG